MTSEQLRYAIELANYKTMQLAADALHISKSGLSRAIHQLEEELDVKLFYRTPAGTFLTKQGEELLPLMRKELNINFKLHQNASHLKKSPAGRIIRIGYANTLLSPLVNTYIDERKENKDFSYIDLRQYSSEKIIRLVAERSLDLGFIDADQSLAKHLSNLSFHPIHTGGLNLFVRRNSPLATAHQLGVQEIRAQRFVLLNDPFNERAFDQLQNLCGPLEIELRTDDYQVACQAVEQLGSAFIACDLLLKNTVADYDSRPLAEKSLTGLIDGQFTYGWVANPQQPLDKQTQDFINRVCSRILDTANS